MEKWSRRDHGNEMADRHPAAGNEGVAEKVQKPAAASKHGIDVRVQFDLGIGLVQESRKGVHPRASLPSIAKAAENASLVIPEDLRFSLTDAPGKGSYPIAATTLGSLFALSNPARKAASSSISSRGPPRKAKLACRVCSTPAS